MLIDSRICPGCLFPDATEGKWPHVEDYRCVRVRILNKLLLQTLDRVMVHYDTRLPDKPVRPGDTPWKRRNRYK